MIISISIFPTQDSLVRPNTIPIRGVEEKQVMELLTRPTVVKGRLRQVKKEVQPRVKVMDTAILAEEEGTTEKLDSSFLTSFITRRIDEDLIPENWEDNYGNKIQEVSIEIEEVEDADDLETAESQQDTFTKEDLKGLVGLVKPLVAELKAGLTTTTDQTVYDDNKDEATTIIQADEPIEETTTEIALIITDYYGDGEDKVTDDDLIHKLADQAYRPNYVEVTRKESEEEGDVTATTTERLHGSMEVMSLVREEFGIEEVSKGTTEELETERATEALQAQSTTEELEAESTTEELEAQSTTEELETKLFGERLPVSLAMTAEHLKEDEEKMFYLPAGHGLRFSFKRGDGGNFSPGNSLLGLL